MVENPVMGANNCQSNWLPGGDSYEKINVQNLEKPVML